MSILIPPHSYATEALSQGFRKKLPADLRYVKLHRIPRSPVLTINQKGVEFRFPGIPDIYLINNMRLELKISLKTKVTPHVTPIDGQKVSVRSHSFNFVFVKKKISIPQQVVNNVLHSCIKQLHISVNNVQREL
jgi:hypothetical protein